MKSLAGPFLAVLYLLSVALYYLDASGTLKYFQYALPAIGLGISLINVRRVWFAAGDLARLSRTIGILCFLNLLVLLVNGDLYTKYFQESFLLAGALFFAVMVAGNLTHHTGSILTWALYSLVGIFMIDKGSALLSVLLNPGEIVAGLLTSSIQTESSLSFYFSLLSLYFIFEKDKPKAVIAILFMILSFKRVAFVGFLAAILVQFVFTSLKINYNRRLYSISLTVFNFAYLWILLLLINGQFDEAISSTLGVSSNFLFMGRVDLYNTVLAKTGYINWFGMGVGSISTILNRLVESGNSEGTLVNLHSDILKYYLEFGIFLFPIFLYKFIHYLARNSAAFCMIVMLNIILLTDNVSIYFGFMVLFYLIVYKIGYFPHQNIADSKHTTDKKKNRHFPQQTNPHIEPV
ncbi:MAG: O-antigen ligase family protein [Spirosoma sp.]|nr:O-antigen ligase family protein [Spirosoma sp.]